MHIMAGDRTIVEGIRHGLNGYRKHKCGCDICREANAKVARDRKKAREEANGTSSSGIHISTPDNTDETLQIMVDATPESPPTVLLAPGALPRAVMKDLLERGIPTTTPGLAATALRLAHIIENPATSPQAPTAAARLLDIYKAIGIEVKVKGGKLASVKAMVNDPGKASA